MPASDGVRAYVEADALVLSDDTNRDEMQASGRWIRAGGSGVVEVRQ